MATHNILVLEGDGIGPEVMGQAIRVLDSVGQAHGLTFNYEYAHFGGASIDAHGEPLTQATIDLAKASDAVMLGAVGGPKCHAPGSGHPVTAGTLKAGVNLCEDRLYFNAHDHDGKPTSCGDNDATWGPSWSGSANNGCPFDDPGDTGSLGPIVGSPGSERAAVGWGGALGLNKGAAGTGANHMKVYIR